MDHWKIPRQKAIIWPVCCLGRYFSACSDNNIVCQWKSIFDQLNKTSVPQVCVLIVWAGIGRFIHTIRITCSLWNCCWKDDLISSLLYYLNSGYCWHARILRSTRHFQMCYPCPNECNWSLWYLVGTCWRRRTTASTGHGCAPVEWNSENQSIEAENIGSTEVFEHPFRILGPVGGRTT